MADWELKEEWREAGRAFLLLAVPFILGMAVFPHSENLVEVVPAVSVSNSANPAHSIDYSSENFGTIPVPSSVNSIFPFSDYLDFPPLVTYSNPQMCFADKGSRLVFQNGSSSSPDFSWLVEFNGVKGAATVPSNGEDCIPVKFNENFTYSWQAELDMTGLPLNNTQFQPNISASHKVVRDYGVLQGLVLIPAFFLFVWYPAAGIFRKIKKGMLEQ